MIFDFLKNNVGLCGSGFLFVVLSLIQLSPIQINPWTSLANFIGRAINREVIDKVDILSKEVRQNKEADDEKWATLKRTSILRFGDEIRHGQKHSKEHFDQILLDISDYEEYCVNNPHYKNNVAIATIELVKASYKDRLAKNDFL